MWIVAWRILIISHAFIKLKAKGWWCEFPPKGKPLIREGSWLMSHSRNRLRLQTPEWIKTFHSHQKACLVLIISKVKRLPSSILEMQFRADFCLPFNTTSRPVCIRSSHCLTLTLRRICLKFTLCKKVNTNHKFKSTNSRFTTTAKTTLFLLLHILWLIDISKDFNASPAKHQMLSLCRNVEF